MKKCLVLIAFLFALATSCVRTVNDGEESATQVATKEKSTESEANTEIENIIETENEQTTAVEAIDNTLELSEEEYKNSCIELFYDDVFFGKENLEEKLVKLHLFLSEKYYFTSEDMLKDSLLTCFEKYNLDRDFFKCCVLRKDTDSYVGKQINLWFSNNFSIEPDNYKTGQKIIVYAKVVNWSNNTMDGYNSVTAIPKYIESE